MAHPHEHLGAHMKPLSEISNYTIERGDPDPRGYKVLADDGRTIGDVEDLIVDMVAMKVRYLVVDLDRDPITGGSDRTILLAADDVDVRSDTNEVVARSREASDP